MKIIVAHDGSESSDAVIDDLRNAGMPGTLDALVMTLADVLLPAPLNGEVDKTSPEYLPAPVKRALERAQRELSEAESIARRASEQIRKIFPGWHVSHEALAESPAWGIVRKADEWKPDLVLVAAHGHAVLGAMLILGSVSQRVLYEASCSVRVARVRRRDTGSPLRLVIGVDNSSYSNAAVDAVCRREWPAGTEARVLTVVDTVMATTPDPSQPLSLKWIEVGDEENWDQVREIFEPSANKLRLVGLDASVIVRSGNPTNQILDEAESWGADCIFLGAKGIRGIDRLLLGSVSSAVSGRAHCSVEVVRSGSVTSTRP